MHARPHSRFHPPLLPLAVAGAVLAVGLGAAGCAPVAAPPAASDAGPRIFFVSPADGAQAGSPVAVSFGAEDFTVEAAGEVKDGHGHLHVMVDTDCVPAGQGIPKDDAHLHYGQGQMEAQIELAPGEHTLCLQAADGNHVALAGEGMAHTIKIVVP